MKVRVIESERDFAALEPEWERLQSDATATSVFQTFAWMKSFWDAYGRGQPLRVLVASDGGAIVGILPLYIHTLPMLKFPVRMLRLVGTGGDTFPDDLGPVLAKGREEEVARALADAALRLPGWDVLLLHDMLPDNAFTAAIAKASRSARLSPMTGRSERIAYLDLPESFDAWLKSLSGDRRYRIRSARKKLVAAQPTARFFVWEDGATLDRGIDRLIELHTKRWGDGQSNSFKTPEYIGCHRAVMHGLFAKDRLRLYCLEASGQIIAMFYFYKFRDRVYLMQSGFDPEYSNVKPGQVLLGHIVEHAIGEGNKVLDFLRGDHRYKDEIASGERETVYVTAFRLRPGALVYRTRRMILPALKSRVLAIAKRARAVPEEGAQPSE